MVRTTIDCFLKAIVIWVADRSQHYLSIVRTTLVLVCITDS